MKVSLTEKPKNPTIIEGFPGFGLVSTIATEFLVKHLNAKPIGKMWSEEMLPIAAIHDFKIMDPIGIFYDKKTNIILIHALSNIKNREWDIAESIKELGKMLNAKEIITLEGVGAAQPTLSTYYYTMDQKRKTKFESIGLKPLNEGIVMGVTGALLLKEKDVTSIFVESQMGLADSKGAAKIIEVLDRYLGLKVDYKPLLKAAEEFENKLKTMMTKNKEVQKLQTPDKEAKFDQDTDYFG
ncbi:MAG: PAC2 family protein [Candidatus Nanoarchaeia archaeon]|nr:PAC2 family protein [Candidatus Nanoarchaeia archaeon]